MLALALAGAVPARGAAWRFEPAQAPPPPEGAAPAPYPVAVGEVGQISFWAPNRGLLITGGTAAAENGPVGAGIYAYDGVSWHQLATVCGGRRGRIAWAGPDEFWTIAEQVGGQELLAGGGSRQGLSLCHFLDGQVVGSYATPAQRPNSYLQMDAAACFGPSDCWFGGRASQGLDTGAFHLHWDGSTVTEIYEPEDHAITDIANFAGRLYESVQFAPSDAWLPSEEPHPPEKPTNPAVLHTIAPAGALPTFSDLSIFGPRSSLPEYGKGVTFEALQGFSLGTDGSPLGAGATQLWAAANPVQYPPRTTSPGSLTVLHYASHEWTQVIPASCAGSPPPEACTNPPLPGATLAGAITDEGFGTSGAIAPEPGTSSAWLSLRGGSGGAQVALLEADGRLAEGGIHVLPEAGEPIGYHGEAGPIACAAPHDCWMATNGGQDPIIGRSVSPGWLFHLTDGTHYPRDTDPNFAGVIAYRPPDAGIPVLYPIVPPIDDSLENQVAPTAPSAAQQTRAPVVKRGRRALLEHFKSRFLHHRVLVISYTLTAKARVQLIARRHRKVVSSTRAQLQHPGAHRLSLSLDPARWPTKLQFKATPIGAPPSSSQASESTNTSPNTVGT